MITDDNIHEAAQAFATIIKPSNYQYFIEDFTMGAKWMRRQMQKAYEQTPTKNSRTGDQAKQNAQREKAPGTRKRS